VEDFPFKKKKATIHIRKNHHQEEISEDEDHIEEVEVDILC